MLSETHHLEDSLLFRAETFDLRFDHPAQALRDRECGFGQRDSEPPAVTIARNESPPDQMVHGRDHEQGISLGVPVDERGEALRQRGSRRLGQEIFGHVGFTQRGQENLVTEPP